ncbi:MULTISPECIES: hypothetical protein [unclassified Microbacterium]|uniref:hypothetical protein n=1 Tax=unclassified Microbacterium TaxID=2609290 RepID=UPI00109D51DB|nr:MULTISPECIES: hypothetical protein [unclassified Microbacterium]
MSTELDEVWQSIGYIEEGELAGSVVALDPIDVGPDDFVEIACWTPHHYTLSILRNIVPRDHATRIHKDLVGRVETDISDSLAARFFNQDYVRVVRGPDEGVLLDLPPRPATLSAIDEGAVRLAARAPLLQALASPASLSADLLRLLSNVVSEDIDGREAKLLMKTCSQTVDQGGDALSPEAAVRAWFATLWWSYRDARGDVRPTRLRDAKRMARAILEPGKFWVSGDWGVALTEIVERTVSRLARHDPESPLQFADH